MNILSKITSSIRKKYILASVAVAVMGGSALAFSAVASADSSNCDANAVVWCGATSASQLISRYNNGDGHNSAASIHNIYDSKTFGITSADVKAMSNDSVNGSVTKTGDVYVGTKLVAKNALTAGRENITGSTKVTNNGTTFYTRKPSVSFLDSSLPAFVVLNSKGVFEYAIITSCGNPVIAVPTVIPPTPKPAYTINKEVEIVGKTSFAKSVTTDPGDKVEYKITVDSTGNAPVQNLTVSDALPSDIQFVAGSLEHDGKSMSVGDFFGKGVTIASLANGTSTDFTFDAIVAPSNDVETCKAEVLDNIGHITATSLTGESSTATVNKNCLPKPVYACTNLTDSQVSRTEYKYTVTSQTSNGATIKGYTFDFGNGVTKTVTTSAASYSLNDSYTNTGSHTTDAYAIVDVAGTTDTVTSPACEKTVTVAPLPPAPVATCTGLKLDQSTANSLAVTATATDNAQNGAQLTSVSFDWGDSTAPTPNGISLTANHTYATSGTYTVIATLAFSPATIASSTCKTSVTVNVVTPPPTPKPAYTINKEVEIVGKTNFAKTVSTIPGAKVEYEITVDSTGNASVQNLTVSDALPSDIQFTAGSLERDGKAVSVGDFFGKGITIASLANGTSTSFTFDAVVAPSDTTATCEAEVLNNVGSMTATGLTGESSTATVDMTCLAQPVNVVTPTCDDLYLDVDNDSQTATVASLDYTPNSGTYSYTTLDWGDTDNPTPVVTANDITGQSHTYTGEGPYTVVATTYFVVNGQTVPISGSTCQQSVSFAATPVTPTIPTETTPTSLVNTGAGNVVGIFAAVSIAGALAYRFFLSRRLNKNL